MRNFCYFMVGSSVVLFARHAFFPGGKEDMAVVYAIGSMVWCLWLRVYELEERAR